MAYETGTALDLEDYLSKIDTFITGSSTWTSDELDNTNNTLGWSKGSCFVQAMWITTSSGEMSVHQSLAWDGAGTDPGSHTDDSGNGYNAGSATEGLLASERCVEDIGDGPYASYHIFEDDSSTPYVHNVAQVSSGVYRHWGFGNLIKTGDWTGGEYVYGQYQSTSTPISGNNTALLDGVFSDSGASNERRAATIHMESLPGQDASSKWGQIWGIDGAEPDDTAGEVKEFVHGGFRSGPIARGLGWLKNGSQSGLVASYPIGLFYMDTTNSFAYFLGYMPDVRGVNIDGISAEEEITIGSDVWVFFPLAQKTSVSGANRTYNSGIMYKKVTT